MRATTTGKANPKNKQFTLLTGATHAEEKANSTMIRAVHTNYPVFWSVELKLWHHPPPCLCLGDNTFFSSTNVPKAREATSDFKVLWIYITPIINSNNWKSIWLYFNLSYSIILYGKLWFMREKEKVTRKLSEIPLLALVIINKSSDIL